jgi:molybdenum cofactor cytidylyltransferase
MNNIDTSKSALIILAAGNSSRLGSPKQLLKYKNITLLQRTIDAAIKSHVDEVLMVTGAFHDEIINHVDTKNVKILYNKNWKLGMGNSLKFALNELTQFTNIQYFIICVSDQPFISSEIINQLILTYHNSSKGIIASSYKSTLGVPVLFDKNYIHDILLLKDEEGAKKVLMQHINDVEQVDFKLGEIDIDTKEDYEKLIQSKHN